MTAPRSADDEALAAYVVQLLETAFTLMTMGDEMTLFAAGRSAPDAPPVPVVLAGLLRDVLPPLVANRSRPAVEQATAVLGETTEIMSREIRFVAPESRRRPRPPARRARRPR